MKRIGEKVISSGVKKGKKLFTQLDNKINTQMPEGMVRFFTHPIFEKRKEKTELEDIHMKQDNFLLYIGNLFKDQIDGDKKSMYRDSFIIGSLKTLFSRFSPNHKIPICLSGGLGTLLNGSKEGMLSPSEQKDHVIELVREQFGEKYVDRIDIHYLEEDHDVLLHSFDTIQKQEQDIDAEFAQDETDSVSDILHNLKNIGKVSSYLVFKYLYILWKQGEARKFFDELQGVVPNDLQSEEYPYASLYPLAEVSIRLVDLLRGVYIQAGGSKQGEYERFIKKILSDNFSQDENMSALQEVCKDILKDQRIGGTQNYYTLHFNTDKYESFLGQEQEKVKTVSRFKTTTIVVSSLLVGILGGMGISNKITSEKNKKLEEEAIKNNLSTYTPRVGFHGHMDVNTYKDHEKSRNLLQGEVNSIYRNLQLRYGGGDETKKEDVFSFLKALLNDEEIMNDLNIDIDLDVEYRNRFVDTYLIPRYGSLLASWGFNIVPYSWLEYSESKMLNTINYEGDDMKFDIDNSEPDERGVKQKDYPYEFTNFKKSIMAGGYGTEYQVVTAKNPSGPFSMAGDLSEIMGKNKHLPEYFLARKHSYGPYFLSAGKEAAKEYFLQRYPVIDDLILLLNERYGEENYPSHKIYDDILLLFINDIKDIRDIQQYKKDKQKELITYLDEIFVPAHIIQLQNLGIGIMPNTKFLKYFDVIQNTVNYTKKYDRKSPEYHKYWHIDWGTQNFHYIDEYTTEEGKLYQVGYVEDEGNKILVARNIDWESKQKQIVEFDGLRIVHMIKTEDNEYAVVGYNPKEAQKSDTVHLVAKKIPHVLGWSFSIYDGQDVAEHFKKQWSEYKEKIEPNNVHLD